MAKRNEFGTLQFYDSYVARGGTLDKATFKNIVKTYLKKVKEKLLEGEKHNIGNRIGTLAICRFDRNFKKPQVNWGVSNKIKKELLEQGKSLYNKETGEGEQWICYHTDPYYYGLLFERTKIQSTTLVANLKFYKFEPFAKMKIAIASSIDDTALIKYEYKINTIELLINNKRKRA